MKILSEDKIKKLRKDGKVDRKTVSRRPRIKKPPIKEEDVQIKTLKSLVESVNNTIKESVKANKAIIDSLLKGFRATEQRPLKIEQAPIEIKQESVKTPKKWLFKIYRNKSGFIDSIKAEAVE